MVMACTYNNLVRCRSSLMRSVNPSLEPKYEAVVLQMILGQDWATNKHGGRLSVPAELLLNGSLYSGR